jgi:hypothetical protein
MKNIFRPISLSEGFIHEKKIFTNINTTEQIDHTNHENYVLCRDYIDNKILTIGYGNANSNLVSDFDPDLLVDHPELKPGTNSDQYVKPLCIDNNYRQFMSENDGIKHTPLERKIKLSIISFINRIYNWFDKKKMSYILKKIFMFMFHLSLISIFEIVFFFSIVSVYENEAIIGIIVNFFSGVPNMCNSFSVDQKEYFTSMFNSMINSTQIINDADSSYTNRKIFNNKLFTNAWMYFLIIAGIDIFLLLIKIYYKIKIKFKKIIMENIMMISILAIYEYLFFKSIILLYQNISQNELLQLIITNFDTCFYY